jgi:hypothetical protein
MEIGFIIPAYKNPKQLEKCITAIEAQKTKHKYEIFVYDNNEHNVGFTRAINVGLEKFRKFDYTVALNQDCYIKPSFVNKLVKFMEAHPKCFISGVKQISSEDNDYIIHGGCTQAFPNGMHIGGRKSQNSCNVNKKMAWVNGACMIVNMDLLPVVGNMDENYFLLASDSDWCYTANMKGAEVWYCADIEVVHETGISATNEPGPMDGAKMLDMVYFKDKWIGDGLFREISQEVHVS